MKKRPDRHAKTKRRSGSTAPRLEEYALLGNCRSAALVSRAGSIDWLAFPRFDSAACCAALLGNAGHGRWLIGATDPQATRTRRYRDGSMILKTEIVTKSGRAELVEFMTMDGGAPRLIRIVRGLAGAVAFEMELVLRFDYGSLVPWVTRLENGDLRAIAGAEMVVLRTPVASRGENLSTVAEFTVGPGEVVPFELTWLPSHEVPPVAIDAGDALERSAAWWHAWSSRFTGGTPYDAVVRRSLVTLKALTYEPTGGMVAAPTTSLPESIGNGRNWDYRYTWLRDATLTLSAMSHAGFDDEAVAWKGWLLRAVAGAPDQMQIMYGVAGDRRLPEMEIPWLPGYANSKPVRLGNAASFQTQLDVFGDIMAALHAARRKGLGPTDEGWDLQKSLLLHLDAIWAQKDDGIWEMRGPARHFVHSKVMAWVAYDRAVRSAEQFQLDGPIEAYIATRAKIRREVERHGYDARRNTFTQSYETKAVDASLLFLGMTGFLSPEDPRLHGTIDAIERDLLEDGLVLRYRRGRGDGLEGREGAFLACSFWLADAYRLVGRTDEARRLFERLAGLCNDVGLLSEEYDPKKRRMLGNFPQAFSHLALVNSALDLAGFARP